MRSGRALAARLVARAGRAHTDTCSTCPAAPLRLAASHAAAEGTPPLPLTGLGACASAHSLLARPQARSTCGGYTRRRAAARRASRRDGRRDERHDERRNGNGSTSCGGDSVVRACRSSDVGARSVVGCNVVGGIAAARWPSSRGMQWGPAVGSQTRKLLTHIY